MKYPCEEPITDRLYSTDELDLVADLDFLRDRLFTRLEQYLKQQIQKRGISIMENSYVGFDTEFELLNERKNLNRLVSVQTAIQRRTVIKLPVNEPLDISFVHPVTSEISSVFVGASGNKTPNKRSFIPIINDFSFEPKPKMLEKDKKPTFIEMEVLNQSLKHCIKLIRSYLYDEYDNVLAALNLELRSTKGVKVFDDRSRAQAVFYLPLTPMTTEIVFPEDDKFSFNQLLEMGKAKEDSLDYTQCLARFSEPLNSRNSSNLSTSFQKPVAQHSLKTTILEPQDASLCSPLVQKVGFLCSCGVEFNVALFCSNGVAKGFLHPSPPVCIQPSQLLTISLKSNYAYFIKLLNNQGLHSNPIEIMKFYDEACKKGKPRFRKVIMFAGGSLKVSLSIVRNIYLIAHYNAADLPMMDGFDEVIEKLAIVGKSFISLGKPFKMCGSHINIRDTILLSPGGNNSLAALGKLYNCPKIEISQKHLENMSGFLKSDKSAFVAYALQDAVIALKHAVAMEEFNFGVKAVGIPSTLSSVGRRYVAEE